MLRLQCYPYSLHTKYFIEDGDKIIFSVKRKETNDTIEITALEIYQNDFLLEQFSPQDIREIVYIAVYELFILEKKSLEKLRNNYII